MVVKYYFALDVQTTLAINHIVTLSHTVLLGLLAVSLVRDVTALFGALIITIIPDAFTSLGVCLCKLATINGGAVRRDEQ